MRRLARKDSGSSYREYDKELIREAGEDPSDAAAVVRFDKKRKGKSLSNQDWQSETDSDSRIAKMKDGRTHLAYKPEHAVDLRSCAMLGISVCPADQGDTASLAETLQTVTDNLATLGDEPPELLCVVTDKGYHQADLIKEINTSQGITTSIPERESRQRRRWHGDIQPRSEFHANRRRSRGNEGKRLGRHRSELVERSFTLWKRSGNLGLLMRTIFGYGTPKGLADAVGGFLCNFLVCWQLF
ncbi:MAG: transposase [Thermodesulfobacteriota bacterium]